MSIIRDSTAVNATHKMSRAVEEGGYRSLARGKSRDVDTTGRTQSDRAAPIRRRGYSEEEAKDLTQELFQRLLERKFLCGLLREGRRFRSFLLTALHHFLVEHWQGSRAGERGGGQAIVSTDAHTAEERYRLEPRDQRTPATICEYRWVMALLNQVLGRLQQEFSAAGKDELFDQLRTYL